MTAPVVVCTWVHASGAQIEELEALLALGHGISSALPAELHLLTPGGTDDVTSETASRFGVSVVHQIKGQRLAAQQHDACVEALAQYCVQTQPRALLFGQDWDTRAVVPRLGARLGRGVVMNAVEARVGVDGVEVVASAYGGDALATYALRGPGPHLLAALTNAIRLTTPSGTGASVRVEDIEVSLPNADERVQVVSPARAAGPRLEDAQVIVAGGRGLGAAAHFALVEQLAEAIGGMPAASRPIVDDGWADASRQIGLTGKIVRPALYVAVGISGASQHMAGCSSAKTIVAINRDPDAAIFRYARYGIVGDCLELVPELIRAVHAR